MTAIRPARGARAFPGRGGADRIMPLLHQAASRSGSPFRRSFSTPWGFTSSPETAWIVPSRMERVTVPAVAVPITIPSTKTASPGKQPRISRVSPCPGGVLIAGVRENPVFSAISRARSTSARSHT